METNTKMTPKFFFLSLGVLIGLITTVTSFLNLAFETLDFRFPDVLNATYQSGYYSYNYDGARMAIATLIIFFPIFLILMRYWKKTIANGLSVADSVIRKWMIYLILFLSAIVTAVDLVTLVRYFVAGEITTRFILKVVIALVVGLGTGVYYILELREQKTMWGFKIDLWSAIKSSVLVLILIIWSFSVIGIPNQQRTWRLDDKRVQDLQNMQYQIINYWQQKEKLPAKITDVANPISGYSLPVDPEFQNGKIYEYKTTGDLSFELCATFSAPIPKGWVEQSGGGIQPMAVSVSDVGTTNVSYPYPGPGYGSNDSWDHQTGRTCFERTIDPQIYPPFPKPVK